MPVSFEVHPKRLVRLPDGSRALVLLRRNVDEKLNWLNGWDMHWEWATLTRVMRRDRTWRVEIYTGVSEEPLELPRQDAARIYVTTDKARAVALANVVVAAIESSGFDGVDRVHFDDAQRIL